MKYWCLIILFTLCNIKEIKACSLVCGSNNEHVLVGFNEDFDYESPYLWFSKKKGNKYGCALLSYNFKINVGIANIKVSGKLNPQQGINENGLFFDGFATPKHDINIKKSNKKGNGLTLIKMLKECSNVNEAIIFLNKYNFKGLSRAKFFLGDKFGNFAIYDGKNIIRQDQNYCVVTNFLESNTQLGEYPCTRYLAGNNLLLQNNELTNKNFSNILYAMQQNNPSLKNGTMYSGIFELKKGYLTLYNYQDYENPFTINVFEALKTSTKKIKFKNIFKLRSYYDASKTLKKRGAKESFSKFISLTSNPLYTNNERDYIFFSKTLALNNENLYAKKVIRLGLKKYPNSLFLPEILSSIEN